MAIPASNHHISQNSGVGEATPLRELQQNAQRLLTRLEQERAASEEINAEQGKLDPMKEIRGISAMDEAIREARNLVAQLDQLSLPSQAEAIPEILVVPQGKHANQEIPHPTLSASVNS